ncbi:MAG: AAA family ATPase [Gammaproteobacteria bacterium]|nr:AAA family ATPase [Gammaproteobacteria bacterium]
MPNTVESFTPYLALHASAGSGKTHQLVNRLIYLLLLGAKPGGILAITFTRKAAAEMGQRLLQRVQTLSSIEDIELDQYLADLGLPATPELRERAAALYEFLLHSHYPVRCTTFHAFCQDLLRRFPMEADVPPGFELIELTRQLLDEAWESFAGELTRQPQGEIAQAMDVLLQQLGLEPARHLLYDFIGHRSDWWALTQGQASAVAFAYERLVQHIDIDIASDPLATFLDDAAIHQELIEFQTLLLKHPIESHNKAAAQIDGGLRNDITAQEGFTQIWSVFFTNSDEPRKRNTNKTLTEKLGAAGVERFLELHERFCEQLVSVRRRQHAIDTLVLSHAWMLCGESLLSHYQRIKQNQRVLDFADLEWNSYLLLTTANHADWVQYKLDQRIDHLLIDEFQDTNPIQWQLVLPLLQELAAGEAERQRSVLFVGDSKQSIYSFRRAEPRLFDAATTWLADHLPGSQQETLSKSWRSSPAVIEFVNKVFTDNPNLQLTHFETHRTEHSHLPGRVSLLPLQATEKKGNDPGLRNPLLTPRPQADSAYYHEAQGIAATINELVAAQTVIGRPGKARYLRYADIMILFRSRTRVNDYERALREAHIPYLGTERGTLLDSLEVKDMINLLQWLITPFNNLALAGILRSPLFAISDDDLMLLADQGDWFARLLELAATTAAEHPLARAAAALQNWIPLADQLPVHDLLDRIYSEANVFARYRAAFPAHLHPRIIANLIRFLELALESDSGRYPSLTRFMVWLDQLRQQDQEAPDQPPGQGEQDRVRLLTVHEAKGLEAPVVFVADASRESPPDRGARILVEWPAEAVTPQSFLLSPSSKFPNAYCADVMARLEEKNRQEDANLLYVALTRAEQYLYISASNKAKGWYDEICRVHGLDTAAVADICILSETATAPGETVSSSPIASQTVEVHPGLQGMLDLPAMRREIAPSYTVDWHASHQTAIDEDARQRGIVIHAMLEALSRQPDTNVQIFQSRFNQIADEELQQYWTEAQTVIQRFPALFDERQYEQSYAEVPIAYNDDGRTVYGIIDRLVCYRGRILIVDYKTHRLGTQAELAEASQAYREQLRLYAEGVRRIYPDRSIRCQLLFTALPECIDVPT